jgi:predicted regulator of Ras-like GTPase activity (Roadblock/LC7/MglB family)
VILAATVKPEMILVVAMAVVLVLIVGVVGAMRQPARQTSRAAKRTPTPVPADTSLIDLEGRLRAIVLPPKNALSNAFATGPQVANFQTMPLNRPAGARLATGPITIQPPRPDEIPALLGPRYALPGPVGAPGMPGMARQTGLMGGLPALPYNSTQPPVVIMPPSATMSAAAKPALPAGGAQQPSVQARQVEMAPPEPAPRARENTTVEGMPLPQLAGPLSTALGTRGFTVVSDEPDESGSPFEPGPLPPSGPGSAGESATPEYQVAAPWSLSEDGESLPPMVADMDYTEIVEPEPAGESERDRQPAAAISLGADLPDAPTAQQPVAPVTEPVPLADEDAVPLGAMPFSEKLLQLATPISVQLDAESLASALGTLRPDLAPSRGVPLRAGSPASPAEPPDSAFAARSLASDDDQVGETQVFSTSDLYPMQMDMVEVSIEQPEVIELYAPSTLQPVSAPQFVPAPQPVTTPTVPPQPVPAAQPLTPPPPPSQPVTPPAAMPVLASSSRQGGLSPEQEAQARQLLEDLASLPDVGFVKLLGPDGTVIVSADRSATDPAIDEHIAVLIGFAIMEVEQVGLGEWTSMTLEAPGVALLLSPLSGGASLAILLSNPARLGLLRRQLRKPLGGLQEVLSGASVS